jgi:hypothetical protein
MTDEGYRFLAWSLFVMFTLGTVDIDVKCGDGFEIRYRSWLDNLIEKIKGR